MFDLRVLRLARPYVKNPKPGQDREGTGQGLQSRTRRARPSVWLERGGKPVTADSAKFVEHVMMHVKGRGHQALVAMHEKRVADYKASSRAGATSPPRPQPSHLPPQPGQPAAGEQTPALCDPRRPDGASIPSASGSEVSTSTNLSTSQHPVAYVAQASPRTSSAPRKPQTACDASSSTHEQRASVGIARRPSIPTALAAIPERTVSGPLPPSLSHSASAPTLPPSPVSPSFPSLPPPSSTAGPDAATRFCEEFGLDEDIAAHLRGLGINGDARIVALGRASAKAQTTLLQKLQSAGLDWTARLLVMDGLARRAAAAQSGQSALDRTRGRTT
ncbi:uncharacterized protein BXZ73DRAFT_79568 [Epithele typhae]|uniref:uncharacterized protein n=1 Tax=Epithele typhae TaxID=378194 RepID=UPI0020081FA0|nr:uncharacterized protein BXZ73DRAFT_79568 [Epithele typhae]KAH9923153.1 hypothetical protein BXZ73DRAFT_79568 [Epithele typhae]